MSTPFWISDGQNDILRYVDATGVISTPTITSTDAFWLSHGSAFGTPWGIAVAPSGNLLVVDEGEKVVYSITPGLDLTRVAGGTSGGGALGHTFVDPYFVTTDSKGNLYISDLGNGGGWVVLAVNMQSTTQTICNVLIAAGDIAVVAGNGTPGFSGDGGPAISASIANNYGVAVDGFDNLYISSMSGDGSGSVVRKVSQTTGIISTFAGTSGAGSGFSGDGGSPTSALLNAPLGIGADANGNIYISDHANYCVRVVNNQVSPQTILNILVGSGNIQTVAGTGTVQGFAGDGGPAVNALLGENPPTFANNGPWAVALGTNELFIADTYNFRIRHVDSAGVITTVAGNGTSGNSGDGGAATSAEFARVFGIAAVVTPSNGNIIVQKVTSPTGSPQAFTFRPSWGAPFQLLDGQSSNSGSLAAGTYAISEDAVSGWSAVVTGGNASNIVLGAGQTITLIFTNTFSSSLPVCYADGIIPTGAIDGVNTSFTLPNAPNPPGSLILESDTSTLAPGVGFNLSFVLTGTQLTLNFPPKTSLVAWYRFACGSQIPPLYKLNPSQAFDDNAFTSTPTAINSTYFTYGFVNAAKSAQNPLLGFHRKRFTEIQMNVNGSGQFTVETFPNYILKQDLSYNPYAYVVPPILLQTDPPDDIIRPLNSVGNRVYVMFQTNMVGATFDISKTIMVGTIDGWATVNPNAG